MNFLKRIKLLFFFILILGFPFVLSAQVKTPIKAVNVYLESVLDKVNIDDEIKVRIFVDSDTPVNVIDLSISYPDQYLSSPVLSDTNSIIQIWQTRDLKNTKGLINLAGGLPRSFAGTKGEIGTVTFKAIKDGRNNISINEANIFYADGNGTKAKVDTKGIVIRTVKVDNPGTFSTTTGNIIVENNPPDIQPPIFSLIDTLKNLANSKRVSIFQVTDSESGIDSVSLRSIRGFSWSDWSIVTNPSELPEGIWKYQLLAKDNAGNVKIESVYIWSKIFTVLSIVMVLTVFLIVVKYFIIKR